jgi:AcrR family transcriptional regulator
MPHLSEPAAQQAASSRLPKAERRRQLLAMALIIVREEGADRLTLGHLATRAGVSKPIAYEHFGTRTGLLAALYKALDAQHTQALQAALSGGQRLRSLFPGYGGRMASGRRSLVRQRGNGGRAAGVARRVCPPVCHGARAAQRARPGGAASVLRRACRGWGGAIGADAGGQLQ